MEESHFGLIGAVLSVIIALYEVYTKMYPYLQNKFPTMLGINSEYNDNILQKLRIEQCYKTQWYGLRTIIGLYQDIEPFLSQDNHKLGVCCKKNLNVTEFYNIISNSFEWRKITEFRIDSQQERKRILKRIESRDMNVSNEIKNDIMSYYWRLHKPSASNE